MSRPQNVLVPPSMWPAPGVQPNAQSAKPAQPGGAYQSTMSRHAAIVARCSQVRPSTRWPFCPSISDLIHPNPNAQVLKLSYSVPSPPSQSQATASIGNGAMRLTWGREGQGEGEFREV